MKLPKDSAGKKAPLRGASSLLALALILLFSAVEAAYHDWRFDEAEWTILPHTRNRIQPAVTWSVAWADSTTTGDGHFRVRRDGASQNSRFDLSLPENPGEIFLLAELAGWDFSAAGGSLPSIRFSLMNGPAAQTPSEVTAEVVLAAAGGNQVTLQGRAIGTGGQSSSTFPVFTHRQADPVALVVAYDRVGRTYRVFYREASGVWRLFFTGVTSATREAISVRMLVAGDFFRNGQGFLDISRIAVTDTFPGEFVDSPVAVDTLRMETESWDLGGTGLMVGSGFGRTGMLRVAGSGNLRTGPAWIGLGEQSTGGLRLDGATTAWESNGGILAIGVGAESRGVVELLNGARAAGFGPLHVGRGGNGRLTVLGGGHFSVEGSLLLGAENSGEGLVEVVGSDAALTVAGRAFVGTGSAGGASGGTGSLRVEQDGRVVLGRDFTLGGAGAVSVSHEGQIDIGGRFFAAGGSEIQLQGGVIRVSGDLDWRATDGLAWTAGDIVGRRLIAGIKRVPSQGRLVLEGPDAFLIGEDGVEVAEGGCIEGTGTAFASVILTGEEATLRGNEGGRLRMVGTLSGTGVVENVGISGALQPAEAGQGVTLRDVVFARGSVIEIVVGEAGSPRIFFDERTDFSAVRLRVQIAEGHASPGEFELFRFLGEGWPPVRFSAVALPPGWEWDDGRIRFTGAPAVNTFTDWLAAFGGDEPDLEAEWKSFLFGAGRASAVPSLLVASSEGGDPVVRWRQRLAGDFTYTVEESPDLGQWSPVQEPRIAPISWPAAKAIAGYQWVGIPRSLDQVSFVRVRVDPASPAPVFPEAQWDYVDDPDAEGVPLETIFQCIQMLNAMDTTGFVAVKGGRILFDYGDTALVSYSASVRKSILSMLYGRYVDSGEIRLDASLADMGINDLLGLWPLELRATVHDLLRARSGVYHPRSNTGDNWESAPARGSRIPGHYFLYNNWDFNALGTIFHQQTGKSPYEALETDFAWPLQMEDFILEEQRWGGNTSLSMHRAYYFYLSTRDMARLGYLMLRRGQWAGEQIIPEEWIERSLYPWTPSHEMNPSSRRSQGFSYSYLWWIREVDEESPYFGSYAAHGAGGQYIMVVPKLDLVLAHKTRSSGTNLEVTRTQFYNLADVLVQGMTR